MSHDYCGRCGTSSGPFVGSVCLYCHDVLQRPTYVAVHCCRCSAKATARIFATILLSAVKTTSREPLAPMQGWVRTETTRTEPPRGWQIGQAPGSYCCPSCTTNT